ncbi:AbrB/MazE/SpoVT family DNA-binding domain-containing protein [Halobacteriales archaeon Cl-PHB]
MVVPGRSTNDDIEEATTRVTRKGQVTIPQQFREAYGLDEGDEVVWQNSEDGIVVRKANRGSARGMLVPDETPPEKREAVAEELEERIREHRK